MNTKIGTHKYESRLSATMERVATILVMLFFIVFLSISFTGLIVAPAVWGAHSSHQCPLGSLQSGPSLGAKDMIENWRLKNEANFKKAAHKRREPLDFTKCVLFLICLDVFAWQDFWSLESRLGSCPDILPGSTHPRKEILHKNVTERGPLEYLDPKPPSVPSLPRLPKKQTQDLCSST